MSIWTDAPDAMTDKVAVGKFLEARRVEIERQRRATRRCVRDGLALHLGKANTFVTWDGYKLRRETGAAGHVHWTDGDLSFGDKEGSPAYPDGALVEGHFVADGDPKEAPPEPPPAEGPTLVWVLIYFTHRLSGGPEEGGWWYDAGVAVEPEVYASIGMPPRCFLRWDDPEIRDYVTAMQKALDESPEWNKDRPDLGSMISNGRWMVEVQEGNIPPSHVPEQRPTYE